VIAEPYCPTIGAKPDCDKILRDGNRLLGVQEQDQARSSVRRAFFRPTRSIRPRRIPKMLVKYTIAFAISSP